MCPMMRSPRLTQSEPRLHPSEQSKVRRKSIPSYRTVCLIRCAPGDQLEFAVGYAGLHQAFAVMGEVVGLLPEETPQVALDGEIRIIAEQNIAGLRRFLRPPQPRQRRGPYRQHLEMIGIEIERFPSPGQAGVVVAEQIMAERDRRPPLIARVAVAALDRHRQ